MKAKELLHLVVESAMSTVEMGFVNTPDSKLYPSSYTRDEIWSEWYNEVFWSDEVCILSEGVEVMYIYPQDEYQIKTLDEANGCWITDRNGSRIYFFEVE